jgi:hypothetical protein
MIDVTAVSTFKLSYMDGFDSSLVTFKSDVDIVAWRINRLGTSWNSGDLLEEEKFDWSAANNKTWSFLESNSISWAQMAFIEAEVSITSQIQAEELQEGTQRINVYGKDRSGSWSPYGG